MSNSPEQQFVADLRAALPNGYQVDGFIDKGGQGAVFSGTLHGQPIALKLFSPQHDPGFRRLEREVPLLKGIQCPHLVRIIDHAEISIRSVTTRCVAYELLGGGDLRQFLAQNTGQVQENQLVRVGHQIGTAVAALWHERIVHRDIKPANVVLRDVDSYVLVDVGLARHLDRSNVTRPGAAPGTPGFMSPEQSMGRRNLTIKSDVFSLGVTLYMLAARHHPFDNSQHNIVSSTFTPRPLRAVRTDLSEAFVRLVHQMMTRRALNRPGDIQERFARFLDDEA